MMHSVGSLLKDTLKCAHLVQSHDQNGQVSGRFRIPRGMVREIRYLAAQK